jgi:hypothetical protein
MGTKVAKKKKKKERKKSKLCKQTMELGNEEVISRRIYLQKMY